MFTVIPDRLSTTWQGTTTPMLCEETRKAAARGRRRLVDPDLFGLSSSRLRRRDPLDSMNPRMFNPRSRTHVASLA
jgi:hypothetical protein